MAAFGLGNVDQARTDLLLTEGALQHLAFVDVSKFDNLIPGYRNLWKNWRITNSRRGLDEARRLMGLPTEYSEKEIAEKAIEAGAHYIETYPQDSQAILSYCHLLVDAGRFEQHAEFCRTYLDSFTEKSQRTRQARIARAYLLAPSSDPDLLTKATAAINRVLSMATDSTEERFWDQTTLGMAQYRAENYAEAEETLTLTINWDVDARHVPGRFALLFRAMARHRLGKYEEAMADFRRGIQQT